MEAVLIQQRYSNDKSGLGYSKFSKPSSNKIIFVKASGNYVWVKKGTNYEGSKATWVPNKT